MARRVVITGMGGITALGNDWQTISDHMKAGRNGIVYMEGWDRFDGLRTRLGGPVPDFELPSHYSRKKVRAMGRVAQLATVASEHALDQAGLLEDPRIQDGRMGAAYGSSTGSTDAVGDFGKMLLNEDMSGITGMSYIQMMGHTAVVNIGLFFELKGRIINTSTACTSGSQGVGYSYEAIKYGRLDMMIGGGGEELCPTEAAVFDRMFATSERNDDPDGNPRPFDRDRDGLVIGEGAGSLILEELEHAQARGANILAEVVGFACTSDGAHVTSPQRATMGSAMRLALEDANLSPDAIGYVCAHGTATDAGDIAESNATRDVFGRAVPISSLKGYYGHTLGACGATEAWHSIEMMNSDWYAPTLNLRNVDERCGDLDYIMGEGRTMQNEYVMSNNFAFGGINTSLIFKRWV